MKFLNQVQTEDTPLSIWASVIVSSRRVARYGTVTIMVLPLLHTVSGVEGAGDAVLLQQLQESQ